MHVDNLTWRSILKHVPNVSPWNTVGDLSAFSINVFHADVTSYKAHKVSNKCAASLVNQPLLRPFFYNGGGGSGDL